MKPALATCLLTSLLTGQEAAETFTTIRGEQFSGHLKALDDAMTLEITGENGTRVLALDQLALWQGLLAPQEPDALAPPDGLLQMRSGMVIPCEFVDAKGQQILLRLPPSPEVASLSCRHLSSLRLMAEAKEDGGFARALAQPPATNDLLYAINRDTHRITRLSVVVQGFIDRGVQVLFRKELQTVPIDLVYGFVFGRDLGAAPESLPRPTVTLRLRDGRYLSGRLGAWDGQHCRLTLAEGITLGLPCRSVRQFSVQSSKVLFLSDLDPHVEQVPAFDRQKPWLRDSAPSGVGLQLGGTHYRRGLCLIPHTKLTFDLDGTFDVFEAVIGIDDRSSREANADFRVYGDDELVFEAKAVGHGQPGEQLRVALAGMKHLILEADFGENFDLGDHCLFADARLLKN